MKKIITVDPQRLLKEMSEAEHSYYQSSKTTDIFPNVGSFMKFWTPCDMDYNRILRWDIKEASEYHDEPPTQEDLEQYGQPGTQFVDIQFYAQRKDTTWNHRIINLNPLEVPKLYRFLKGHWEHTKKLWAPVSTMEYTLTEEPSDRFIDKIVNITNQYTFTDGFPVKSDVKESVNNAVNNVVHEILKTIDDSYLLFEKDSTVIEASTVEQDNIAGTLVMEYFQRINS